MTSANSGDHGLTVFIPLSVHAKIIKLSKVKLLQSLLFAHYITWYIKSHVGHLCGMCGCSIAAGPGAICGIAYQLG
jgi:L-cysteine desulfidase